MRKIRFHKLFIVLIVAIILCFCLLLISFWGQKEADKEILLPSPQVSPLGLPSLPLTPKTMTEAQKQAAIERAVEDAFNAALASGQSEEKAQIAANLARQRARSVFYPRL